MHTTVESRKTPLFLGRLSQDDHALHDAGYRLPLLARQLRPVLAAQQNRSRVRLRQTSLSRADSDGATPKGYLKTGDGLRSTSLADGLHRETDTNRARERLQGLIHRGHEPRRHSSGKVEEDAVVLVEDRARNVNTPMQNCQQASHCRAVHK